jgi:hypothetical protein
MGFRVLLALMVSTAACGGDDDGGGGGGDGGSADGDGGDNPDCTPPDRPAAIVYLNRDGATFTRGPESSVDNTTLVVEEEEFVFEPHPYGPNNWQSLVGCFRAGLSPFHIDVVTEDPGAVDHTEIVFSTTWLDTDVASISAFSCASYPRGTAFVFSDNFAESDWQGECDLALQQFGVVGGGLDHSFDCRDYMSYLDSGCDEKSWVDEPLPCGELQERACMCDRASQNSFQIMLDTFGPACVD